MSHARQTVTARYAMPQYTGPRKSEAVPFCRKVPFCCEFAVAPSKSAVANHPALHASNSIARHPSSSRIDLGGGDGLADAGTTLPGVQADILTGNNGVGLLDNLLSLGEDQLDVAGVGHVGVDLDHGQFECSIVKAVSAVVHLSRISGSTYATVGTVSSSALLGGLVDLDVLDDQGTGVKTLRVGVGLGVLEELEQELGGLDGPPGTGDTPGLAYLSLFVSFTPSRRILTFSSILSILLSFSE